MASLLPSLARRALPMLEMPRLGGKSAPVLIARRFFQVTAASPTSTDAVPAGATRAVVKCIGAGGQYSGGYGKGGGGGAYARNDIKCAPGQIASISIGRGGAYSSTVDGEPTTVTLSGVTVSAAGGKACDANSGLTAAGGLASDCIGKVRRSGGAGSVSAYASGSPGEAGGPGGIGLGNTYWGGGGSAGDIGDPDSVGLGGAGGGQFTVPPYAFAGFGGGAGGGSSVFTYGNGIAVIEYWSL